MKVAVVGGAGFIGSHLCRYLISMGYDVICIDDFSVGTIERVQDLKSSLKFKIVELDCANTDKLTKAISGCEMLFHLASNADISAAESNPRIDFLRGTLLTESVAEASRISDVKMLVYASGSGVYRDSGEQILDEDSPLEPKSTYGASKLAGETLLASYSHMFGIQVNVFRFANVVGPNQTHGVGFDFVKKLKANPKELLILGDGNQSKSYIYVSDVVSGLMCGIEKKTKSFDIFNVSTNTSITVTEIAQEALRVMNLPAYPHTKFTYTGGKGGWKGDVPIVRLNSGKLRQLGWRNEMESLEAIRTSLASLRDEI